MKKILGTLKGKILAVLVAVGLVSGAGIVFAATGAGEQLQIWYASLFNQTVDNIEADVEAYSEGKLADLTAEYEELKATAGVDIDLSRELATGNSLEEIIQAKLAHIEEIDAEQQEILANIGYEFYNVFLDGYMEIIRNTNKGLEYATNDLGIYTAELGNEAIGQMTNDITAVKDNAVADLENAIRQAQETLGAELETQEEITTRNLMNQVNWAVDDLRKNVVEVLDGLVTEQEAVIIAKAKELENEAKAALDEVVSGINK
ncbi:hypothetical protein [Oceanobacillus sp. FSL H7-0719]|uniref:hypothetical protein n=1 Tax=Oceanobacillus sp. FSL H7-0719 TaxID=2954507 RepID=UPI0032515A3B